MNEPLFAKRALALVVGVSTVSFTIAVLLAVFGQDLIGVRSYRNDSYSYSAIGHLALVRTLEELDIPVYVSTWDSARRAGKSGVLLLLEPPPRWQPQRMFDEAAFSRIRRMLETSRTTLIALPKWAGEEHEDEDGWVGPVRSRGDWDIQSLLDELGIEVEIVHPGDDDSRTWNTGGYGPTPAVRDVQLMRSNQLDPLIDCDAGILVGEFRFGEKQNRLVLLSDPDLLSNHGLGRDGNALLAVRLIESLRLGGAVVVDETAHGFEFRPTIFREAFRFPLSLVSIQLLVCLGVLLWAGMGRFGSPRTPPPPLDPGNRYLIRNTAELLRVGGHSDTMLRRYFDETLADVRRQLHMPDDITDAALRDRLARLEQVRGTTVHYRDVRADVDELITTGDTRAERIVDLAERIHRWRGEILDGPGSGSQGT